MRSRSKLKQATPKKKSIKHFQIVDDYDLSQMKSYNKGEKKTWTPVELTKKVVRSNKFIYIDINEDSGMKIMDSIDHQDSDEQTERFGNNFVGNLGGLSQQNQKINIYLSRLREMTKKKDQFRAKIKSQLQRSGQKIKQMGKNDPVNSVMRVYRGMDSNKLKKYLQAKELDELNEAIVQKERKLVSKFGIVGDYKSVSERQNQRVKYPPNRNLSPLVFRKFKTIDTHHHHHHHHHQHQHHNHNHQHRNGHSLQGH